MPAQLKIRSEESKKHCKTPERGDIVEIIGNVEYVVSRISATRRAELTIIIVRIADRYRYTALIESDVCEEDEEDYARRGLSNIKSAPVLINEEVMRDAR